MAQCFSHPVNIMTLFVLALVFQIKQTMKHHIWVENSFPLQSESVIRDAPSKTNAVESWDSVAWKEIDELRQSTFDRAKSDVSCRPKEIHRVDIFDPLSKDRYFNCSYPPDLPLAYHCGAISQYIHPFLWECRLKSRLFGYIDKYGLRNVPFTGIDLGVAFGDWLVAVGSYAPQSRLIGVEASRNVHQEMVRQLTVNPKLSSDRISVHHAAAVSKDAYENVRQRWKNNSVQTLPHNMDSTDHSLGRGLLFDNQQKQWRGPTLCLKHNVKGDPGRTSVTGEGHCDGDAVPAVALDWLLGPPHPATNNDNQHNRGTKEALQNESLFFLKIDIEGGELSALQGGDQILTSLSKRPCLLYVELKRNIRLRRIYEEAFQLITTVYNYTDYEDVDAGIQGLDSFPPKGAMYENEGNYEFRLPPEDFLQCVQRVRRATATASE